ncbi:MAG: DUF1636 family protein [Pseudomonadota bacterium]
MCARCSRAGRRCIPDGDLIPTPGFANGLPRQAGSVRADSAVDGTFCAASCDRRCTVSHKADRTGSYLFRRIDAGADVDGLVAPPALHAASEGGGTGRAERPLMPRGRTLARIPGARMPQHQAAA